MFVNSLCDVTAIEQEEGGSFKFKDKWDALWKGAKFPQQIEFVVWWLDQTKKLWRTSYMCDSRLLILNFTINKKWT